MIEIPSPHPLLTNIYLSQGFKPLSMSFSYFPLWRLEKIYHRFVPPLVLELDQNYDTHEKSPILGSLYLQKASGPDYLNMMAALQQLFQFFELSSVLIPDEYILQIGYLDSKNCVFGMLRIKENSG